MTVQKLSKIPSLLVIPSPSTSNGLNALGPPFKFEDELPHGRPYGGTGSALAGYHTFGNKHVITYHLLDVSSDGKWLIVMIPKTSNR